MSHSRHHKVAWWCSVTIEEQILLPCAYLIELSSECKLLLCRKSGSMGQAAQQRRFNGGGCVELLLPKVFPQALLGGSLVQRENITNLIIQFFTWQFYIGYIDLGRKLQFPQGRTVRIAFCSVTRKLFESGHVWRRRVYTDKLERWNLEICSIHLHQGMLSCTFTRIIHTYIYSTSHY